MLLAPERLPQALHLFPSVQANLSVFSSLHLLWPPAIELPDSLLWNPLRVFLVLNASHGTRRDAKAFEILAENSAIKNQAAGALLIQILRREQEAGDL